MLTNAGIGSMAPAIEHGERVRGAEARAAAAAGGAGARGAARARAGGPHARGRGPARRHEVRRAARAPPARAHRRPDALLQL